MFYDRLKQVCAEKGTTVTALIKELNMSSGNVGKWKAGGKPRAETIKLLADKLGVSYEYLVSENSVSENFIVKEVVDILDDHNISVFALGGGDTWLVEHHSKSMLWTDKDFRQTCVHAYELSKSLGEKIIPDTFLVALGFEPLSNLSETEEMLIKAYRAADAQGKLAIIYTCEKELRRVNDEQL